MLQLFVKVVIVPASSMPKILLHPVPPIVPVEPLVREFIVTPVTILIEE